jgi:hypothetical protein
MKVKDIKIGEIFSADNTATRPKIKLREGFVDMFNQYVYINRENVEARKLTEIELTRIRQNWGMTLEKFEEYKQKLIKKYSKEVLKCQGI